MNSEQAINAKREDAASSRIPSRPGTASFTRPAAIPTPTKAATAVSRPTAAASKSGPAGGKSSTAASRPTVAAAAAKRAATQQTGARRVGKIGGRATDAGNAATANGPVPLLSAVSGPEEELAMAAQAAVEEESQPAAPQQVGLSGLRLQQSDQQRVHCPRDRTTSSKGCAITGDSTARAVSKARGQTKWNSRRRPLAASPNRAAC